MKTIFFFLLSILVITSSTAQIKIKQMPYNHGEVELEGSLYYDPLLKSIRAGVLLIPDIWGTDEPTRQQAQKLAELGFIVLIIDMFDQDTIKGSIEELLDNAENLLENKALVLERATLGYDLLKAERKVDPAKIGIVGYGFGGTVALELASSGVEAKALAVFYAQLNSEQFLQLRNIRASVLILHGSEDPYVANEDIYNFQKALTEANLNWQMNIYGAAVRGFVNSELGFEINEGMAYNYNADLHSWDALRQYFIFALK